jgi:chemosensory pili system protein ChpA (sensor histidine kinase/response regulator)
MRDVLIADDEPMVARLLRIALERAGYRVSTVPDGLAAWERIRQAPPDVLITDIDMPRMNGEQLCRRVQAELPDRTFPICVLTSKTALEHRDWSSKIDDVLFLEKPVSVRTLIAKLEEHFQDDANPPLQERA